MSVIWNNYWKENENTIRDIRSHMTTTEKGQTKQTINNCRLALEKDPLLKGAFRWNRLTERIDLVKNLGWQRDEIAFGDADMSYLMMFLEMFYGLSNDKNITRALDVVAMQNQYHPICDYFESLEWDGKERIRYVLHRFLGADASDITYESMKVFLIGCIHRVFDPGCKFEYMLCLVGDQGAGKSSFFRFLAVRDEWFSDDLKKMDDENVYRKMHGHWIIEMAEMLGTASAKSVEEIKAFFSRPKETYKTPYAKYPKDRKRQCVFVGTSNKHRFLPLDRTGNRRFLPITVNSVNAEIHILENEEESRKYIDQLWAEAYVIYKSGKWSMKFAPEVSKKLDIHRLDYMAEDTTTGVIQAWIDNFKGDYVCTRMIYNEALKCFGNPDRKAINEINDIMNNTIDGWEQGPASHRFGGEYGTQRAWHREGVNEALPDKDGFISVADQCQQLEIPFDS